ncbi:MAG: DUF4175 family protein [Alphaproteobacteria bacterium]|nr:DUF4175 family protein [Rhodospirillaceae bacterium]MDG2481759.1 DUF4175 family protein [Alphaproteobacteria bacterium]
MARAAIFWEGLLTRLWRGVTILMMFAGLALLGLWAWLPGILHVVLLALFVIAIPVVLWRDLRGVRWPDEEVALRRLEQKSGFDHRPLLAVEDDFAGDPRDEQSQLLFEMHRQRMAERIRAIRIGRPLSDVSSFDHYAVRSIAVLVLAIGLFAGWSNARANLMAVLSPDFSSSAALGEAGQLTLWITPPAYTGIPPLWMDALGEADSEMPIAIPAGSELVAQVRGGSEAPVLSVDAVALEFEPAGLGSYQVVHVFEQGSNFAIKQAGHEIASWSIEVIPDGVPLITLTEEPTETLRTSLRLDVLANDDYGIAGIQGTIKRTDIESDETLDLSVPIAHVGIREMQAPIFYNYMAHPWAGMDVSLVLTATDVVGQETRSQEYFFTLPERFFLNPVARSLNDQRKLLVQNPNFHEMTGIMLEALTLNPDAYLGDSSVHLALVSGAKRLFYDHDAAEARDAVVELMWDTALAVEEGPLAFAEERVRDLQERLLQALSEGASAEEIDRLLEELRLAMDDYMRALSNRLRTDPGDLFDPTDALKAVGSRELTDLVDQIRELVRTGSTEQAQTLLTRLQEIMENVSVGNLSDLTGSMSAQAAEVIHTIRQLMTNQQELLDDTFRMLRENEAGEFETEPQAETQGDIQGVLKDLMARMEEFGFGTVREFSRADRSMGRAVRQLDSDRPSQAVDHQTEAIEYLRAGADALMEEMMEQAGEEVAGDGSGYFGAPRDPMGRHLGGQGDADTTEFALPDKGAIIRAREILDELYKRAGELYRPLDEQEYLQRLLRRF